MALFLIMAVNRTHPDPVKDQRGCYKRGDIVDIYDEQRDANGDIIPFDYVANPVADPFVIVAVSGVTKAQAEKFLKSETVDETDPNTGEPRPRVVTRRLWRLRVDDLPAGVLQQLRDNRFYQTTLAAARTFLRNKVTGLDDA